eukprot:GEMP01020075.1.p1 GENE.GEMP01020075.1~~GEMP01020075.1.p1  ORF type:complete len:275 (+),score=31.77 GEMP01020075.1:321-1145(+)
MSKSSWHAHGAPRVTELAGGWKSHDQAVLDDSARGQENTNSRTRLTRPERLWRGKQSEDLPLRPSSAPPQYSAAPMGPHSTLGKGGTRFGPPPSTRPSSAQATRSTHRSPGQGEYVLPSSFRYDIGHQFGRKLEWPQRASSVPGPGAYNDRKTLGANRSPKYSIAFKRKDRTKRFQGPAPYILPSAVRYDVGRQFGRIVQMPNHASSAPGPGTYAIPQGLGVDRSPKYSMYFRRDDIRKLRGPDPYLLPSTLTGPRFSFGRGLHCVNVTRTRTR